MAHVNKTIEGEAMYWKKLITDTDYDTLFQSSESDDTHDWETQLRGMDPMPKEYLHLVYGYTA